MRCRSVKNLCPSFSIRRTFHAFALVLMALQASAQPAAVPSKGQEFWLGFMRNFGGWGPPYILDVIISSETATSGTVHMPRMGHEWPFTVVPGTTTRVTIPVEIGAHIGSEYVDDRAILVQALDSISVFAVSSESYTSDGTVVYPVEALGTDYRVMAYSGLPSGSGQTSEFLIVATQDGTEVEITTTAITAAGQMPGVPWVVQLDSGQTYHVQAFHPAADFTGTTVRATEASGSCRPFAVFGGSACAEIPIDCWACDHLFEQMMPVNTWGSSYHVVPFVPATSYLYRVLAHEDGTQVTINGGAPITLAAGAYHDAPNATGPVHVQADRPVAVGQFMKGFLCSGAGDPSMVMVSADHQRTDRITFTTVVSVVVDQHHVNVVVNTADVGNVTLDGVPVPPSAFTPFPADPFMQYAILPIAEGSHTLACPGGLLAYVYGTGTEESYAYSVGANTVVPVQPFEDVICGTGPDGTVTLTAPGTLTDPVWTTFTDPSTILHQGPTYTFTPTTTQAYVVTGTQHVSQCPVQYIFSVELDVPPVLEVTASATQVCAYQPVQLNVAAGPMGNYTYQWTPAATLSDATIANPVAQPVVDTWYHVTVSTPSGCATATGSVLVQAAGGSVVGYTVTPEVAQVCSGQPVQLNAIAWKEEWADDFDNGVGDMWLNAQGWALSTSCGSITGDALYFNGVPERYIETNDMDLSTGGLVRFALVIGSGSAPCENADPGDDVVLEYSTNGGASWTQAGFYVEWAYPEMTPVQVELPAAAQTPATRLRWRQLGTWAVGQDNWALDHVSIAVPSATGLSFQWSPIGGLNNATVANPVATVFAPTVFQVSSADPDAPCVHTATAQIDVTDTAVEIFTEAAHLCEGGTATLDAGTYPGYLWSTGATTQTIVVSSTGSYSVQVLVDGCLAADTVQVVLAPPPGELFMEVPQCGGPTWTLTIPVDGGSYQWASGETTQNIVVNTPGEHHFTVEDAYGCTYDGMVLLTPYDTQGTVVMPNVFSPNGDGRNETFGPLPNDDLAHYRLQVYNRWGQLVFEGENVHWNGRVEGGPVPEGTYFYIVDIRTVCDEAPVSLKGAVTVLR